MANTCLVTKLQGTITGDNLIKFGTLKLLISRKYLTLSDNYVNINIRYTGLTDSDTPTAKFSIPTVFNEEDYEAGEEIALRPTYGSVSNQIKFKISDIPADGTYAYITHKYNIHTLGGSGVNIDCIMTPMELSYLTSIVNPVAIAIEGGSVAEMDCPNMERITYLKNVTGKLSDYPYPEKIKNITISMTSFPVVYADIENFTNLTSISCYGDANVVLNTSNMISLFSIASDLNSMDARSTANNVTCDANTFAAGLKTAGVVSRTISITLYSSQWGDTGSTAVSKTFTFDANGDYVIS